jgi:hypothetical protein
MPSTRATTTDLKTRVERSIKRAVTAVAGGNELVSKSEQRNLTDTLLKDVATDLRAAGGPGARLKKEALVDAAVAAVESHIASANQPSGSGAAFISAKEVKTMLANNPAVGAHVAKAYQLITGRRVTADEAPAPGVTGQLGHNSLNPTRLALIADRAREVASSGDMDTGSIPPGQYIILPVTDRMPPGRSFNVYMPFSNSFGDPNAIERMFLESIDAGGITRTASFDVALSGPRPLVVLDVQGIVEAPITELASWHDSGDIGVNVTFHALPNGFRRDRMLEHARDANAWTSAETKLTTSPLDSAAAIDTFLARAESALIDNMPASEDASKVENFLGQVRASFSQLEAVQLTEGGDLGGLYLLGRANDGYVAVVVQAYAH